MLTGEQLQAVRCDEDVLLTACPGSGKTRVIISKLTRAIEGVRETPRAVACITYTNAAVHEIERRLRHHIQPGDDRYFDICTIHSLGSNSKCNTSPQHGVRCCDAKQTILPPELSGA